MRAFILSTISGMAFWMFQNFDLVAIAREFGFPIVVCSVMFIYFTRQIGKGGNSLDAYRHETVGELKSQTNFLKQLLLEAKKANVCQAQEANICKFEK